MHKFFVDKSSFEDEICTITGEDVKHAYKVLRLKKGESVTVNNLSGEEFLGEIIECSNKEVQIRIVESLETHNEAKTHITLFQGLPKGSKMDLITQKCTELGVKEFIPVITARTDIKVKEYKKVDRLRKIILEACKQCKRSHIPTIDEPVEFEEAKSMLDGYDLVIVPYENEENTGLREVLDQTNRSDIKKVAVIIGPEGGFEPSEIEDLKSNGAKIISLGNRILRTETAGIVASSIIFYELGDLGGSK